MKKVKAIYIISIILVSLAVLGFGMVLGGLIFEAIAEEENSTANIIQVVGLFMGGICFPMSYLMDFIFKKVTKNMDNIQK